ncbi:hypothetical protein Ahia01_001376500 [Argonauta hians]
MEGGQYHQNQCPNASRLLDLRWMKSKVDLSYIYTKHGPIDMNNDVRARPENEKKRHVNTNSPIGTYFIDPRRIKSKVDLTVIRTSNTTRRNKYCIEFIPVVKQFCQLTVFCIFQ